MLIATLTTSTVSMADNNRYALVPAFSNRTGAIFGTLLELRNRKMILMAPTE